MQLSPRIRRWTVLALAVALLLAAAAAAAKPSNKWRLEFSGGADSDGKLVLRLSPEGGEPFEVTVEITDGTSENGVAKTVVKGLKAQLSKDVYHVERDDGEDVLVKRRHGNPNFDLEIVSFDVKGSRVHPQRE